MPPSSKSPAPKGPVITLRGANRLLFSSKEPEVMLAGPADTGKSVASVIKMHAICCLIPGAQGALLRKTAASLAGSIVKTFLRETKNTGVVAYGGENPSRFIYPNGSCIWLGGLDNPDRVLSSERDFIAVCQAEEISLNDWEYLTTRANGRGALVKYPQVWGDCNPGGSKHWIRTRAAEGKLRLLNARHVDNPTIYDDAGQLTEGGKKRLAVLQNLSGVRRKRLLEGIWATAEGAVYDMFDPEVHVKVRPWQEMARWFLTVDEGYTNPAVVLLIGEDSDGRQHCFREFYRTGTLQGRVIEEVKRWANDPVGAALSPKDRTVDGQFIEGVVEPGPARRVPEFVAVDESAAGLIADMINAGINAVGGKGRVLDGIATVQNRLRVQGDGRPRLTIDPSCCNLINELESYIWGVGKNGLAKDVPNKEHDHALDALRYLQDVQAVPTGAWDTSRLPALPEARIEHETVFEEGADTFESVEIDFGSL